MCLNRKQLEKTVRLYDELNERKFVCKDVYERKSKILEILEVWPDITWTQMQKLFSGLPVHTNEALWLLIGSDKLILNWNDKTFIVNK